MMLPKISVIIIYGDIKKNLDELIENLKNQTFRNFEVIFVNCEASEQSIRMISKKIENIENIHLLTLPDNNSIEFAKNSGLDVASGEYVCFVDFDEAISTDFIENIYYSSLKQTNSRIKSENNKLYKRSFIDNHADINQIIENKIEAELKKITTALNDNKNFVKEQLDNCYKNTDSNVNNKVYNISTRCSALERLIYEKENILDYKLNEFSQRFDNEFNEYKNEFNADIRRIEENLSSQLMQKHSQFEEEIRFRLQENMLLAENICKESEKRINDDIASINQKIELLFQEQDLKYNTLKNMLQLLKDELNAKIEAGILSSSSDNIEKINNAADLINLKENMNKNFDNVYAYINDNNKKFYSELTDFYREVAEKIKK